MKKLQMYINGAFESGFAGPYRPVTAQLSSSANKR